MAEFPPLANPDIVRWVGERSYTAALGYARGHAISHPRVTGLTLKARCQGSRAEPYRVEVTLHAAGIASGACSCPVGAGGRCKHAAALLLVWLATPEDFREAEPLDRALDQLSKEQLVDLLLRLARRSAEVEELLELSLPAPVLAGAPQDAAHRSGAEPPDASAAGEEVTRALRQGERGMASPEEVHARIQAPLDGAEAALDRGEVPRAAATYQAIIEAMTAFHDALGNGEFDEDEDEYYARGRYTHYDDEYGEEEMDPALLEMTTECVDQGVEGLRRCLDASGDRALRQAIFGALFALYRWGMGTGQMEELRQIMGNDVPSVVYEAATPAERHYVATLARQAMPPRGAHEFDGWGASRVRQQLAHFWLELERDTLDDAGYLAFCREAGLTSDLVGRLLDLDRVDEAADEADQTDDAHLLPLAGLFSGHGQGEVFAAVVRERARTSHHDAQYLSWLQRYAQEAGRPEEALGYAKTLFWQHPGTEGYQQLRSLAGPLGQWEALRAETLARLEKDKHDAMLTYIYLLEHDMDHAIQAVDRLKIHIWGHGGHDPRVDVARAAETARPDDAVRLYTIAATDLIALQGRDNYAAAAQHLARVRAIFRQQARGAVWQVFIADLRAQHKRLRALQDELKQAGLFDPEPVPPHQPAAAGADRADDANKPPSGPTVHLLRADGTV